MGDQGVSFIFGSGRLQQLIKLDLSSNQITSVGATMIAQSDNLQKLLVLDLCSNKIGDDGLISLI